MGIRDECAIGFASAYRESMPVIRSAERGCAERLVTTAAPFREDLAFAEYVSGGFRVIESGEALAGWEVVGAAFDGESALSRGGGALLKGQDHPGNLSQQ